jgi:DNA-binding response OmpR family regulator
MIAREKPLLETILIVEPDSAVLGLVRLILERAGFCCLTATTFEQALEIEGDTKAEIHLLLSSVMIHAISGPTLAEVLKKNRPKMRVMFMSGYPQGDLLLLNYGWHFIEKPFVPEQLVAKLNEILHAPDRSQGDAEFHTDINQKASGIGLAWSD